MEFLDEESRPRFLFQSRVSSSPISEPESPKINKPLAFVCISISSLLAFLSIFFFQSETLKFFLQWISISLLVGPFAPISITGGDIRVGHGELLQPIDRDQTTQIDEPKKRTTTRRQKTRRSEDHPPLDSNSGVMNMMVGTVQNSENSEKKTSNLNCNGNGLVNFEEKEWTDEDFDLLKKQISKHPVGEPSRWDLIAEAFRGRHGLESVIKTAKSMSERKPGGGDPFSQFLKHRKTVDQRVENELAGNNEIKKEIIGDESLNWSSGEDITLLNALKAFPKDVPMRWEKIAVAVPGKSKACCMKRVAELKRDFRSSKSSAE